jgi:hypothetical protein
MPCRLMNCRLARRLTFVAFSQYQFMELRYNSLLLTITKWTGKLDRAVAGKRDLFCGAGIGDSKGNKLAAIAIETDV